MSFARRKKNTIAPTDLSQVSPQETEAKIIAGVKRFATNQNVWAEADANTPFLGHIIGMGIESANMVDITMTMEKLFLTPGPNGPEKLVISEGEDMFAATPGLAVKMLMEGGHLQRDEAYLENVISFANIVVMGEGYRLGQQVDRAVDSLHKEDEEAIREQKREGLEKLVREVGQFQETCADPQLLMKSRQERLAEEEAVHQELKTQLAEFETKLQAAEDAGNEAAVAEWRGQIGPLKVRLNKTELTLRVARRVAEETANRKPVEEQAYAVLQGVLKRTVDRAAEVMS